MKKILVSFYTTAYDTGDRLEQFDIIEDIVTKFRSVKCRVWCCDGVERYLDYTFAEFENTWKINLTEVI